MVMTTWAAIPARMDSARFPGKPLALLAGKPVIQHVWERVQRVKGLDRVFVVTPNADVHVVARGFGADVVRVSVHDTGTDAVAAAVKSLGSPPDWVLNVQGDEALIDPCDLEALLARRRTENTQMYTLVKKFGANENRADLNLVKVTMDWSGFAMLFSRWPLPRSWLHIGVYLYRMDLLERVGTMARTPLETHENLEQMRVLENGYRISCVEAHYSGGPSINTPGDLARAKLYLAGGA